MRKASEHEYTCYPRRFKSYRWSKPIKTGILGFLVLFMLNLLINYLAKEIFGIEGGSSGYDGTDYYTAGGAFYNLAPVAAMVPSIIIAAMIVRDRPVSSYYSSMGGWRWKVFLKALAAAFLILGVPTAAWYLAQGRISGVRFTPDGFLMLTVLLPFQCLGEEMIYRGFITQTVSSWFMFPAAGVMVQIVLFLAVHPYNVIGSIGIALSALTYALACVITKGLEVPAAMHIINNLAGFYIAGFGFSNITSEQTVTAIVINQVLKTLLLLFIVCFGRKRNWFSQVKRDDVEAFNAKVK